MLVIVMLGCEAHWNQIIICPSPALKSYYFSMVSVQAARLPISGSGELLQEPLEIQMDFVRF